MSAAGEVRPWAKSDISTWLRRFRPRGLFAKYAVTIVCLVVFVLAVTGAVETWIIYRETTANLARVQKEAAQLTVQRVNQFLSDIERQVSWATRASASTIEQHRADYALLLQQVRPVAEIDFIDGDGREQLRVTRVASVASSGTDLSGDPLVSEGLTRAVYFGPAYFRDGVPYLPLSMAHSGYKAGITIARIDLRVLSTLFENGTLGANYAYVLDTSGRVLAASHDSPIDPGADLGQIDSIKTLLEAGHEPETMGRSPSGQSVLRTSVHVRAIPWVVVVEVLTSEALRPIRDFLLRLVYLLALGLVLAIFAGLVLARRMIVPIQALQEGAASFATNRFDHRISVSTGDELEELAGRFNRMADDLAGSYARLEQKVEERTRDLARSVRELKALEEIGRALSSSLDLAAVLSTVVSRAVELTHADAGAIFSYDGAQRDAHLEHAEGFPADWVAAAASVPIVESSSALSTAISRALPISIPQLHDEARFPLRDLTMAAGFQSALVVGLVGTGGTQGALVMYRRQTGDFPAGTSGVMQTFAHQSVLAMHNARLFRELVDKSRQLEVASAHRTQFFANMSHELRTPLNAVLGYSELLVDGLYGDMPDRAVGVLERIQSNGKHLLGLINDVLDLTKLGAGGLTLALDDYAMKGLVEGAVGQTESLARTKGLTLETFVPDDLPMARGDERRLTQVLLNLIGNAIKFTDEGGVTITVTHADGLFTVAVADTGPGIPEAERGRIFEDFQQIDNASTRKKGGTGLGLAISRRLVEMHGGRISVSSPPGEGAVFSFVIPVRVEAQVLPQ